MKRAILIPLLMAYAACGGLPEVHLPEIPSVLDGADQLTRTQLIDRLGPPCEEKTQDGITALIYCAGPHPTPGQITIIACTPDCPYKARYYFRGEFYLYHDNDQP